MSNNKERKNWNEIVITGRLTKDAENYTFDSGAVKLGFRIANNMPYQNKAGEWQNGATTFIGVEAWGQTAEMIMQKHTLRKGDFVKVKGEIQSSTYTNKDGAEVSKIYVKVKWSDGVELITARGEEVANKALADAVSEESNHYAAVEEENIADDLPF